MWQNSLLLLAVNVPGALAVFVADETAELGSASGAVECESPGGKGTHYPSPVANVNWLYDAKDDGTEISVEEDLAPPSTEPEPWTEEAKQPIGPRPGTSASDLWREVNDICQAGKYNFLLHAAQITGPCICNPKKVKKVASEKGKYKHYFLTGENVRWLDLPNCVTNMCGKRRLPLNSTLARTDWCRLTDAFMLAPLEPERVAFFVNLRAAVLLEKAQKFAEDGCAAMRASPSGNSRCWRRLQVMIGVIDYLAEAKSKGLLTDMTDSERNLMMSNVVDAGRIVTGAFGMDFDRISTSAKEVLASGQRKDLPGMIAEIVGQHGPQPEHDAEASGEPWEKKFPWRGLGMRPPTPEEVKSIVELFGGDKLEESFMKVVALLNPATDGTAPDTFGQRDRLAARMAAGLPADAEMKKALMTFVVGMYHALRSDDLSDMDKFDDNLAKARSLRLADVTFDITEETDIGGRSEWGKFKDQKFSRRLMLYILFPVLVIVVVPLLLMVL